MPKLICCCNESEGITGYYVAVPCEEFESTKITDVGESDLFPFTTFPTQICSASNNPAMPFAVTSVNGGCAVVDFDATREVMVMMRASGGGARPDATGGNAAYGQFIFADFNIFETPYIEHSQLKLFPGGTGHGAGGPNDTQHIVYNPGYGGVGAPIGSWGGGSVWVRGITGSFTDNEPQIIVGAGGGAGSAAGSNGGHGGINLGTDGLGENGGGGGTQTTGGSANFPGEPGDIYAGGRGGANWLLGNPPPTDYHGGGGGAGWYGGGGGYYRSGGGGGSSRIDDDYNQEAMYRVNPSYLFSGNEFGPGNRANPYFEFEKDPGLGANRKGRNINGVQFESDENGVNSQVATYKRNRWCPCFEDQSNNPPTDTGGNISLPLHICITEDQYAEIISNLPSGDPPQLNGVGISFELNEKKWVLVKINPNDGDPTSGHYKCTVGCEEIFITPGQISNVKWYIPISKNFLTYKEAFDWSRANFLEYNFTNTTTCCDAFIGKPICKPGTTPCSPCGCNGGVVTNDPPPAIITCRENLPNIDGAYITADPVTGWVYLFVPSSAWTLFGHDPNQNYVDDVVKKFEFTNESKKSLFKTIKPNLPDGNPVTSYSQASDGDIIQKYCSDIGPGPCSKDQSCLFTLDEIYEYTDFFAMNNQLQINGGFTVPVAYSDCRSCEGYPPTFSGSFPLDAKLDKCEPLSEFDISPSPTCPNCVFVADPQCEIDCLTNYNDGTGPNPNLSLPSKSFVDNILYLRSVGAPSANTTSIHSQRPDQDLADLFNKEDEEARIFAKNASTPASFVSGLSDPCDGWRPQPSPGDGGGKVPWSAHSYEKEVWQSKLVVPPSCCACQAPGGDCSAFPDDPIECDPPGGVSDCDCLNACLCPDKDFTKSYYTGLRYWLINAFEFTRGSRLCCSGTEYDGGCIQGDFLQCDLSGPEYIDTAFYITLPACMFKDEQGNPLSEEEGTKKAFNIVKLEKECIHFAYFANPTTAEFNILCNEQDRIYAKNQPWESFDDFYCWTCNELWGEQVPWCNFPKINKDCYIDNFTYDEDPQNDYQNYRCQSKKYVLGCDPQVPTAYQTWKLEICGYTVEFKSGGPAKAAARFQECLAGTGVDVQAGADFWFGRRTCGRTCTWSQDPTYCKDVPLTLPGDIMYIDYDNFKYIPNEDVEIKIKAKSVRFRAVFSVTAGRIAGNCSPFPNGLIRVFKKPTGNYFMSTNYVSLAEWAMGIRFDLDHMVDYEQEYTYSCFCCGIGGQSYTYISCNDFPGISYYEFNVPDVVSSRIPGNGINDPSCNLPEDENPNCPFLDIGNYPPICPTATFLCTAVKLNPIRTELISMTPV